MEAAGINLDTNTWLLVASIAIVGILLLFYFVPSYAPKLKVDVVGPFDMSSSQSIFSAADTLPFFTGAEATFQGFFYVVPSIRTIQVSTCDNPRDAPNCNNGVYEICTCSAATCANCAHPGYTTLFTIGGNVSFEVMTAPDASRQGRATAQLVINTFTGTTITIETLQLPPIEYQKWVMITVAREGRRFDVYYNDTLVHSEKTQNMFVNTPLLGTDAGSTSVTGMLVLASMIKTRLTSLDVSQKYKELADTRGTPNVNIPEVANNTAGLLPSVSYPTLGIPSIGVNLCPSGNCLGAPKIRPASPLDNWNSPYG
jgi:hypothetical protein